VALADKTVAELLDQLAARTPAPGGGAAAAIAAATAAALTEMATGFAATRGPGDSNMAKARDRVAALRARLLELADEDMTVYQAVLDALALDRADPTRASALKEALSNASDPPLRIATAATEIAELADAAAAVSGNAHLLGDATAAVVIAEAATRAAARLVELNLERSADDVRVLEARELARRATAFRERTLALKP
jgi:methenyltetrahydrofolate cyclohydrolase